MNSNPLRYLVLLTLTALIPLSMPLSAEEEEVAHEQEIVFNEDITHEIPVLYDADLHDGYEKVPNVAQYKNADWSNVVGIAKGIPLRKAKQIANDNPEITFFFHMKGRQMILEKPDGTYRIFYRGDAVFFSGAPWWGSAPGYADGYIKINPAQPVLR